MRQGTGSIGKFLGTALLLAGALLAGCSGSDGSAGPAGPPGAPGAPGGSGPPGSSGGIVAIDVGTARLVTGAITGVNVPSTTNVSPPVAGTASKPVVAFTLVNEIGEPLKGLPPGNVRITIAKLSPGQSDDPALVGVSSRWQAYINRVDCAAPAASVPAVCNGTASSVTGVKYSNTPPPATGGWTGGVTRQATTGGPTGTSATTQVVGTLIDNKDGTYFFQFTTDLDALTPADFPNVGDPKVAFDGAATHRIGLEFRGLVNPSNSNPIVATNNPVYTYVPATGSTTTLPARRDIVNTAECSACHDKLAFHGGPRTDVQYCVTCHNLGTKDATSGNVVDLKFMVHKIHRGKNLPSVVAAGNTDPAQGKGFTIFGNANSLNNFNDVAFPQDLRNCSTCHRESDASTPQASNYWNVINAGACLTCHDTTDPFSSPSKNHGNVPSVTSDADCVTCHGPTNTTIFRTVPGDLRVKDAHAIPEKVAATRFQFNLLSVTNAVDGGNPTVKFSITDPTNANAPYNILTDAPFAGTDAGGKVCRNGGPARLAIDLGWSTTDYTNVGSGSGPGQPVSINPIATIAGCAGGVAPVGPDGTGAFTVTSPTALPAGIGTMTVMLEGHPAVDTTGDGAAERIAVKNAVLYVKVNDATAVARRNAVVVTKCDDCHNVLSLHGNNRTDNPQVCVVCHNPSATDVGRRPAGGPWVDGLPEQAIDFKWMIHAIHSGEARTAAGKPTVIYGFGGSVNDFGDVVYPGQRNNCEGCHVAGGYYPVDATKVQATTFSTGASRTDPSDDTATSPNMAVCSACHTSNLADAHMRQNGGSTTWGKTAQGTSLPNSTETCELCHAQGRTADVKVVHGVGDFKFN